MSASVPRAAAPDLGIRPLTDAPVPDPAALLREFRGRYRQLPWWRDSRDTLFTPVASPLVDMQDFVARVLDLYRAHLKVVHAMQTGTGVVAGTPYARLYPLVREYYSAWPAIGPGELLADDVLLDPATAQMLYGRPDVVMSAGGPRVVETNFDSAVGGIDNPDDIWHISAALFGVGADLTRAGSPVQGMAEYFEELAAGHPTLVRWIMRPDAPTRALLDRRMLRLNSLSRHTRHHVTYAGDPVPPLDGDDRGRTAWLHRACSIFTLNRDRERFAATLAHLASRVARCTVPLGLAHLGSKLFLAWLSDPQARPATLTADEIASIEAIVPWTRLLKALDGPALERVRRERGEMILKQTDSHDGRDVVFGCNLTADEWQALVDAKLQAPDTVDGQPRVWIVQERVHPQPWELIEYTDEGAGSRRTGLSCCPYIFGGRLRGVETWVMPFTPDHVMLDRMQWVGHFLEKEDGGASRVLAAQG